MYNCTLRVEVSLLQCFYAWFPYDRPDHLSHFKTFWDDPDDPDAEGEPFALPSAFLLILRHREARRNPWWHSIMFRTWCHALALSFFNQIAPLYMLWTFLYYYFFLTSAVSKPNSFLIAGIKVMISGIDFDRPNRLSHLRVFPYDRFKIYTVVPIVRDRTQVYPRDQGHPSHLGHLSLPR